MNGAGRPSNRDRQSDTSLSHYGWERNRWSGKTILLYSEQGLGDSIQFCRYAKLVAELGARVVLEVQKPLVQLFSTLAGVTELIEMGNPLPAFDYQCPLMSLPLAFRTTPTTIPNEIPYIDSEQRKSKILETRSWECANQEWGLSGLADRPNSAACLACQRAKKCAFC